METSQVIVRTAAEGERRWFLGGGVHIWKLTAAESGGQLFLFEDVLVEGKVEDGNPGNFTITVGSPS